MISRAGRAGRRAAALTLTAAASFWLSSAWPLEAFTAIAPIAEARALLQHYHEDPSRIDRARDALAELAEREPSVEALVVLAWLHLTWADLRATTPEAKLAAYARGRDAAQRALEREPGNAEAHLWHLANLGRWAVQKGKLQTLFLLPALREEVRTILTLAPNHPMGLSVAGSLDLETPGLFGGDPARAEAYQKKALAVDPHFTRARVELAKCLMAQRRFAEARWELLGVLDERQPSYYADWVVRHRPTAERLLRELETKS